MQQSGEYAEAFSENEIQNLLESQVQSLMQESESDKANIDKAAEMHVQKKVSALSRLH